MNSGWKLFQAEEPSHTKVLMAETGFVRKNNTSVGRRDMGWGRTLLGQVNTLYFFLMIRKPYI